jgi:uncharacterized membrane protein
MSESPARSATAPGQSVDRVVFFTDAVFAIAMTLLVIEIPRPDSADFTIGDGVSKASGAVKLWHFLTAQDSSFFAYLLAFYLLWIVWREHHELFDQVTRLSGPMIGLHFPLLLLVAFLPYPTTIVGHYLDNPVAALLFALAVGGLLLCRSAIQLRAYRDGVLQPEVDKERFRANLTVSFIVTGYWLATLAVVWWTPWVLIPWILTSGVAAVAHRVMARRLAAHARDHGAG